MELNPFAYEFHDDPYPTYRWLREHAPLYRNEALGFHALSRFRDVVAASADWQTYSSAEGTMVERMDPAILEATPMMIWFELVPALRRQPDDGLISALLDAEMDNDHGVSLGASLARLESRVALEEFAGRFPRYRIDESRCVRVHMSNVHGYESVPFTVGPLQGVMRFALGRTD